MTGAVFHDDFESGELSSQLWPRKLTGRVTSDSGTASKVLSFGGCGSGGDVFSATFSCSTGYYRYTFWM